MSNRQRLEEVWEAYKALPHEKKDYVMPRLVGTMTHLSKRSKARWVGYVIKLLADAVTEDKPGVTSHLHD